jgi:hypothetical protein
MPENPGKSRYRVNHHTGKLEMGKVHVPVPRSRMARMFLGLGLIVGGVLGFLPVVGFWMLPLGVILLSHDLHIVRRWRRRFSLWWARRKS